MKRDEFVSYTGTVEPLTLAELKEQLPVGNSANDPYLSRLIVESREIIELHTGRSIRSQNRKSTIDLANSNIPWWSGIRTGALNMFTPQEFEFGTPPVRSIEQILVYNLDNSSSTYHASNYRLSNPENNQKSRLVFNYSANMPINLRERDSMEIYYTAGFADGAVPSYYKAAIRALAAFSFANKVACSESNVGPSGAYAIISMHRQMKGSTR